MHTSWVHSSCLSTRYPLFYVFSLLLYRNLKSFFRLFTKVQTKLEKFKKYTNEGLLFVKNLQLSLFFTQYLSYK